MSHRGLSELHFVPRGLTVTAQYNVEEVLKKSAASAMKRKRKTGPPTQVELLPKMSEAIFQQGSAPAYHATCQGRRHEYLTVVYYGETGPCIVKGAHGEKGPCTMKTPHTFIMA